MNPGEITTTEINTEIKLEVKVETEQIVKVETIKNQPINPAPCTQNQPPAALSQHNSEKSREEIKAEREAKKLAKQAKKTKSNPSGDSSTTPAAANTTTVAAVNDTAKVNENSNNMEGVDGEKSREQIKAEREAKKLAKQAAKAAKTGGGTNAAVENVTGKMAQVKIADKATEKAAAPSGPTADEEKVNARNLLSTSWENK